MSHLWRADAEHPRRLVAAHVAELLILVGDLIMSMLDKQVLQLDLIYTLQLVFLGLFSIRLVLRIVKLLSQLIVIRKHQSCN